MDTKYAYFHATLTNMVPLSCTCTADEDFRMGSDEEQQAAADEEMEAAELVGVRQPWNLLPCFLSCYSALWLLI